ncbi:MAG: hypothetical protein HY703_03040 [Gemmatimonadetes bacterium]|nr:hypothetical protein [Gemmatimonadota bacterium]
MVEFVSTAVFADSTTKAGVARGVEVLGCFIAQLAQGQTPAPERDPDCTSGTSPAAEGYAQTEAFAGPARDPATRPGARRGSAAKILGISEKALREQLLACVEEAVAAH